MKKMMYLMVILSLLLSAVSCTAGDKPSATETTADTETTATTETSEPTDTSEETQSQTTPESDFEIETSSTGYTYPVYHGTSDVIVMPEKIGDWEVTVINPVTFLRVKKTVRSITLPETLKTIESSTFQGYSALEEVNLPDSLTMMEGQIFRDCTSLKHIRIPGHCVSEKSWASFWGCTSLESVELCEGIEYLPGSMFIGTNLKEVVFPSTMKKVDYFAFEHCTNLEKVVLNEGLEVIGEIVFEKTAIKELVIPKTVKEIYDSSFSKTSALKEIRFEGDAPLIHITDASRFPNNDCVVYYHEGAKGFTSPKWGGYQTEKW